MVTFKHEKRKINFDSSVVSDLWFLHGIAVRTLNFFRTAYKLQKIL
jgi:hypothetical protein